MRLEVGPNAYSWKQVCCNFHYFAKWTEAFPVMNADGITIARLFVEEILCRPFAHRKLLSDGGENFLSKVVKGTC